MRIYFRPTGGARLKATLPFAGASYVIVEGACPACSASPLKIAGIATSMVRGHDTYTSDAQCIGCKDVLGRIVVHVSTIFGIEEDERVLHGRYRVY